jgi:hypothetical protein
MASTQDKGFRQTLRRMLSTPPKPHETTTKKGKSPKRKKQSDHPMPKDDPEKLIEWGKRNI